MRCDYEECWVSWPECGWGIKMTSSAAPDPASTVQYCS